MTVKVDENGESKPIRGCRVVQATLSGKSNPAQEQGSALTYARRYSVLMAYGLCTSDDDAACMTVPKMTRGELMDKVLALADIKGVPVEEICGMAGVADIADLPDNRLEGAIDWLSKQ